MAKKLSNIEKDLEVLVKKTEEAAQLPLDAEIEELQLIRTQLQELKKKLPLPDK
jgi:hypothetical protein